MQHVTHLKMTVPVQYLETNLFLLLICGLYPYKHEKKLMRYLNNVCYIAYVSGSSIVFLQCLGYLIVNETPQLAKLCFTIMFTGITAGGIHILLHLKMNKAKLATLFDMNNRNFKYESETEMIEIDMKSAIRNCSFVTRYWLMFAVLSCQILSLFVIFGSKQRSLVTSLWYPYDWTVSPYYEVTSVLQLCLNFFMPFIYGVTDIIFPCFSILNVGRLKILEHNMKNVMYTALIKYGFPRKTIIRYSEMYNETPAERDKQIKPVNMHDINLINHALTTKKFNSIINKLFKKDVIQHLVLLDFCKKMEDLFSPVLLVKIRLNMIYYCMMIITVVLLTDDKSLLIAMVPYLLAGGLQLFVLTYFGQIIQDASLEVQNKLYECPWYMCPPTFKKSFSIVQVNISKPITFTAGKPWKVNLDSFVKFMNTIASYVAVLRNVMNK